MNQIESKKRTKKRNKRLVILQSQVFYGGQGWIRTIVDSRRQIYSLVPLTTRPPTQIFNYD